MVYTQNFELGVPVTGRQKVSLRTLFPSNVLNVDYCCVSYFGV